MDTIRINSADYKEWLKKRNNKRLSLRTRKKQSAKQKSQRIIEHNRLLKLENVYNPDKKRIEFSAPDIFSFIESAEETIAFFNGVIRFITNKFNYGKYLFFDISKIKFLSIDSLMYLLAIVGNLKRNFKNNYIFQGNFPDNPQIKNLLLGSGFSKYVRTTSMNPLEKTGNNLAIRTGHKIDINVAKAFCDFIMKEFAVPKKKCCFMYDMIMELMANTSQHAYNNKSALLSRWYCFAESNNGIIKFTFLDTGEGIPNTIYKKAREKIDFLGLKSNADYMISALKGDFRTATKMKNRGRGLPKILKYSDENKIQKLSLVSGKGKISTNIDVAFSKSNLISSLNGTLYYWEVTRECFGKEHNYVENRSS